MASAVTVSAACIGDDILLPGISADGGVGNIRDRSLALGPEHTFNDSSKLHIDHNKSKFQDFSWTIQVWKF